jgi:dGTPase
MAQLKDVALFDRYRAQAIAEYPHLAAPAMHRRCLHEAIRRMLSAQVYDVIEATQSALEERKPLDVADVRKLPTLVQFSAFMREQSLELKQFLFRELYRHPQVMETTGNAKKIVRDLFSMYFDTPGEMKPAYAEKAQQSDVEGRAVVVADFIAGMTDRFAIREHERLSGQRLMG